MTIDAPRSRKVPGSGVFRMPPGPTALDLFAGCGGLTEGLRQAGFTVLGAIEIDGLAVETYRVNHPEVRIWHRDIQRVSVLKVKRTLRLRAGQLDLLAGCPPCQGFSQLRTLRGARSVDDPRNDLIFDFLRFVRGLKPKVIMLENVPDLAEDERFTSFCRALEALGYVYHSRKLDASHYGVPQRRERLILLASRKGLVPFAGETAERPTVEMAIRQLPPVGLSGDPCHDVTEHRTERVMDLIRAIPKDGGSRADLGPDRQLPCHKRSAGFYDVYGRMAWQGVAPTITSGCYNPSKGRFLHPEDDRAITLREAALLQSFPRTYYFCLKRGKSGVAEMIGNALPPEFIRRLAVPALRHVREYGTRREGAPRAEHNIASDEHHPSLGD